MKIRFTGNSYCGITELYDRVAKQLGFNPTVSRYNCTKITVAKNIADNIFDYYKDQGVEESSVGMTWVIYGPKAVETLDHNEIEIEDGFVVEEAE